MFEYIRWQILSWRSKYWKKCVTKFWKFTNLYINLACLSVCLGVCLYPINVKTAEPIRPKFCVGPHVSPGKVYEWSKFQIFDSIKIRFLLNFWKFWKSTIFLLKSANFFFVLFYDVHKENMFTIEIEDGCEAPLKA